MNLTFSRLFSLAFLLMVCVSGSALAAAPADPAQLDGGRSALCSAQGDGGGAMKLGVRWYDYNRSAPTRVARARQICLLASLLDARSLSSGGFLDNLAVFSEHIVELAECIRVDARHKSARLSLTRFGNRVVPNGRLPQQTKKQIQ